MIYRKFLGSRNGVNIWLVDGFWIRNNLSINFTEGGHDLVYNFIPSRQVWIDRDVRPIERKFIVLHEMEERKLMEKGISYGKAHNQANRVEEKARGILW